jgi:hypothetical protein
VNGYGQWFQALGYPGAMQIIGSNVGTGFFSGGGGYFTTIIFPVLDSSAAAGLEGNTAYNCLTAVGQAVGAAFGF